MKTRRLGNSDLEITVLGFGSWAAGGGQWEFAWGPQTTPPPSPRFAARSSAA